MADPIRLPNNTPKGIPTAKVTRTARQRFKKRQKKKQHKQDMRHLLNREKERSPGTNDTSGMVARKPNEKKVAGKGSQNRPAHNPVGDQGNVIDVCI
jgi:hypothetical protein